MNVYPLLLALVIRYKVFTNIKGIIDIVILFLILVNARLNKVN